MTETTAAPAAGKRRAAFNTLEVTELRRLTEDSVEVTFAVPEELADDYDYVPGPVSYTHLTLPTTPYV